jgi:SM-20-related protein
MPSPAPTDWLQLFRLNQFFAPDLCRQLVAEMKQATGEAAIVYGRTASGAVDQNFRKTLRLRPSVETIELVTRRMLACQHDIAEYFAVQLTECEDAQFLRYREGDFFVAHQDGNTGLLRLETERRRVSTVIFLSRESDEPEEGAHRGGSLVFTSLRAGPNDDRFRMVAEPGTLIAFRSETTHEVTPLTHGERYSIVSWYK